jgi:hypothetical protein
MRPEKITPLAEYVKKFKGRSDLAVIELKKKRGEYKGVSEDKTRNKEDILSQIDATVKSGNDEELDKLQKELEDFDKSGTEIFEDAQSLEAEERWKAKEMAKNTEAEGNRETEKRKIIDKLEVAEKMGDEEEIEKLSKELEIVNKSGTEIFEEAQALEAGEKADKYVNKKGEPEVRTKEQILDELEAAVKIGDAELEEKLQNELRNGVSYFEEGQALEAEERRKAGEKADIPSKDIEEFPKEELKSGENNNEKLAELRQKLEDARKEYLEMDYEVDKESSRLRKFFGLKRIDLGMFEKRFKESRKNYEIALNNYLSGMAENKINEKEITEYLLIKETAQRREAREQVKIEKSPNVQLLKKGWKGIVDRYRALPTWKRVAYGTALGAVAGFGAGAGLGIAIGGTTGTIIYGGYRAFCAAVSITGFKAKYEAKAEERQLKKNKERTEAIIRESKIEGQESVQMNLLLRNLDKIVAKTDKKAQREKQQQRWRTFRALGMTALFAGAGYYLMSQHDSGGIHRDIEAHQPEVPAPSIHMPHVPLSEEDQIRIAENLNPPAETHMPLSEEDQIRLAENDNPPVNVSAEGKPELNEMEKALLEDYARNNEEITSHEAVHHVPESITDGNTEHLSREDSGVQNNISPGAQNAGLTAEEINKLQDYEDLANQEMKVGNTIPEAEPEINFMPENPANYTQDNISPISQGGGLTQDEINKIDDYENAARGTDIAGIEKEINPSGKIDELIGDSGSLKENVAHFRHELFSGNHNDWMAAENMSVDEALKDLRADLKEKLSDFLDKSREVLGNEAEPLKNPFTPPETLREWSERVVRLMMEKRGTEFLKI